MKVKVLREFEDIYTNQLYQAGDVIVVSKKRFDEMVENLSIHGGNFLEKEETEKTKENETIQD